MSLPPASSKSSAARRLRGTVLERIIDSPLATGPRTAGEPPLWRRPETWGAAVAVLSGAAAASLWKLPDTAGAIVSFLLLCFAAGALATWGVLRRREARLVPDLIAAAVQTMPEARLIAVADGRVLYANPACRQLFPAESAKGTTVGADGVARWLKPFGGDDGPVSVHGLGAHVADGTPWGLDSVGEFARLTSSAEAGVPDHAEIPFRGADGGIVWRRLSVQPLSRAGIGGLLLPRDGGARFALWRGEDITARREFETINRQDADMMADLLGNLPAGFFSADGEGRVVFMNAMLADWLGVDSEAVAAEGRRFADFVAAVSPVTDGQQGPTIGDITLKRADGRSFRAVLVQSERGGEAGGAVYSRSLVLRDLAPSDTGAATDRLHWLFDAAPVGIVLTDMSGEARDCNDAYLRLTGASRDDVLGHPIADALAVEDRPEVAAQLSKLVMGAVPAATLDVHLPVSGGRDGAATLYATRMVDSDGDVTGLLLHFIDTTEQKQLEAQFAQSQKMQAVGQLAGGVAHDFNNLLTAMIGFCDLLLARHGPDDPSFADIMQIKQNANRATNLVRQLLAFSRREAHRPVAITVNEAVSDLSGLLGRLLGEHVTLNMEPGRDADQVFVDHGQFDQVIINLAVNARDAMQKGGTLTIRTGRAELETLTVRGAATVPPGDYVTIDIIDTGVGISRENLDRIFEPFFSTKEVGEGTGLGLSTVYGIVSQAGGAVAVDSAPSEGTAFTLFLPRYTGAAAVEGVPGTRVRDNSATVEAPPSETDLTGAGTVLIVEDEDPVRMFGARALKSKGYTVLEARNGEEAIDWVNGPEGAGIDLIVSDVVMPGMDGHTLIKLVRQERPDLKVVLMSGYAEDVFREEIDADSAVDFLPKPFTLKDLAAKVKDVLES